MPVARGQSRHYLTPMICPISQLAAVSLSAGTNLNFALADVSSATTGLRSYSPELGRWVNRDPIGEKGGVNIKAFVENSTTNRIDSLGRFSLIVLPPQFPPASQKMCCDGELYNPKTHCCCGNKTIRSREKQETGIKQCCWYEFETGGGNNYGWIGAWPNHCWIEYPGGARGFWPSGVIDETYYPSLPEINLQGVKQCTELVSSSCEHDFDKITQCMASMEAPLVPYYPPFNDCRHWADDTYKECVQAGRRKKCK